MKAVKLVVAIALFHSSSCIAQQVTGELGSPSATTHGFLIKKLLT